MHRKSLKPVAVSRDSYFRGVGVGRSNSLTPGSIITYFCWIDARRGFQSITRDLLSGASSGDQKRDHDGCYDEQAQSKRVEVDDVHLLLAGEPQCDANMLPLPGWQASQCGRWRVGLRTATTLGI